MAERLLCKNAITGDHDTVVECNWNPGYDESKIKHGDSSDFENKSSMDAIDPGIGEPCSTGDWEKTREELIEELVELRRKNEELSQFEVREAMDLSKEEIRDIVLKHIESKDDGDFVSVGDIASEYCLDYDLVEEVMDALVREGHLDD